MVSRSILILLVALVTACSTPASRDPDRDPERAPERVPERVPDRDSATQPAPAPQPRPDRPSTEPEESISARSGLLEQAAEARQSGDWHRAEGLLLRAQRIDARNAQVYLELARLYDDRGDERAAANMAERGMLYCSGKTCTELRRFRP